MPAEPIAVVGRGCVLPDALTPASLWTNIRVGLSSLDTVPPGRWALPPEEEPARGTGGFVTGFEAVFDNGGFRVPPTDIEPLDPVFRWLLHAGREALRESGAGESFLDRAALVVGNLSYPTPEAVRWAADVWKIPIGSAHPARPDPRNRFFSGLPAQFAAKALGLGLGGFALDAACASSLYAIKLACDRLRRGEADLMLAGGVNHADSMFVHHGFRALSALSPTGRSRPFHRDADGLVPAEGAGTVALTRLADARSAGMPVLGVIRGIGLSNDGAEGGLLGPARSGQERAMEQAYEDAGVAPDTVSLVECHATGTPVGDAVEARAMAQVFRDRSDLPIGSVKSNLGHTLTTAGIAGLLKILGAFEAGTRPPTLHADRHIDALDGTVLRLLHEAEEWPSPRRAAVSGFGFGGANAHLVVDEGDVAGDAGWAPLPTATGFRRDDEASRVEIAVVGLAVRVGDRPDTEAFRRAVIEGEPADGPCAAVAVDLPGLRFPPADLEHALGQQVLMLETAREAVVGQDLPEERTAVVVGLSGDLETARHSVRWRMSERRQGPAEGIGAPGVAGGTLTKAQTTGAMPNLIASRLNVQLDLRGPGYTVSAEEASGLVALDLAAAALRNGEVDAAVVGAADLAHEPGHRAADVRLGRPDRPGDAAVVVVLKRLADARRDGSVVLAVLGNDGDRPDLVVGDLPEPGAPHFDPVELFGRAHAATGLLALAAAVTALRHRVIPGRGRRGLPRPDLRTARITVAPLGAPPRTVTVRAGSPGAWSALAAPRLLVFSGRDRADVSAAARAGIESDSGPARLAVVVHDDTREAVLRRACDWLDNGGLRPPATAYRDAPLGGEVGFVYTNGSAAYDGMGRELALALPGEVDRIFRRKGVFPVSESAPGPTRAIDQIVTVSRLALLHTEVSTGLLGLTPDVVLGYSSGESTALIAQGVWPDAARVHRDVLAADLFTREVSGEFRGVRRFWARHGITGTRWVNHLVHAPAGAVRAALTGERAVHLMAVNAPDVCVVGGEEDACEAWLSRFGARVAVRIGYDLAAHAPEVAEVAQQWWDFHHRPAGPVSGVRFYNGVTTEPYTPTTEHAAKAMMDQATQLVDFAGTVERAYADGVRVFVEHGPRGLCTGWIRRTLGELDHLAVALDAPNGSALRQLCSAVAELAAAGVSVEHDALFSALADAAPVARSAGPAVTLPAHPPPVHPPRNPEPMVLSRAPQLPPVPVPAPEALPRTTPARPAEVPVPARGRALVAAAHRNRVSVGHRHFLEQLGAAHTAFLLTRQRIQTLITSPPSAALPARSVPAPTAPEPRSQPHFGRDELEYLATGRVSELFGPRFAAQDGKRRQTRLPAPPMLLVDRVTAIDAQQAVLGCGVIHTETDVTLGSWYLDPAGRMPAGVLVEAGQADLLLISWMGVDLEVGEDRVYRLLGCELTYHGEPPRPGETLRYEIHVDGHAEHNGVRLMFFHYDCHVGDELRLTVRGGQAGFFTDRELAASAGVRWDPVAQPPEDAPVEPPVITGAPASFDTDAVRAFATGRPAACFGPGWRATRSHVRTPRVVDDGLLLLDEVTEFAPGGGPWGRGYLRARTAITGDEWFFAGHFHNDPCMPGTLMLEGGIQAMAFYLTALGHTVDRDGWRFEPVTGQPSPMLCRGQATPESHLLTYEVFVVSVVSGPEPTLIADLLCTVDGVPAFHAARVGLRLVPDWPLEHWRHLGPHREQITGDPLPLSALGGLTGQDDTRPVALVDGVRADLGSMLASAWGRPSAAFGPQFAAFDGVCRCPRLPGPPYHFISRVISIDGTFGSARPGARMTAEYDVPAEAWYFEQNSTPTMPFAALMEVALQPCGWLATYTGGTGHSADDLLFRNLDGEGTVLGEVGPGPRVLRTEVELLSVAEHNGIIIEQFAVECTVDGVPLFTLRTTFGFFPPAAFVDQVGLPPSAEERARLAAPGGDVLDLRAAEKTDRAALDPPGRMLRMLDRITGYWPDGGAAGLGRLRGEKDVDPGEWYFRAHFFQDPVQPGSLGVEAVCQLLQHYLVVSGRTAHLPGARFEPVMTGSPLSWKYRGQVVPVDGLVTIELEITEAGDDERGVHAIGSAWLWVDGRRIYHLPRIGMRAVAAVEDAVPEKVLDPAIDHWLGDHRPWGTVPVLPMMSMVDLLAEVTAEQTGLPVSLLRDVRLSRWLTFDGPVRMRVETAPGKRRREQVVTLSAWRNSGVAELSRFETVATALVRVGERPFSRPRQFDPLPDAVAEDPYLSDGLFHGEAFHYLVEYEVGTTGASGSLDAGAGTVPPGLLHQGLLDGALHVIPHHRLRRWSPLIGEDQVSFPHRVDELLLFEPLPRSGTVRVEARFAGFADEDHRLPKADLQLIVDDRVAVSMRLVLVMVSIGRLGALSPRQRRTFIHERRFCPDAGLSVTESGVTSLTAADVTEVEELPGLVTRLYALPGGSRPSEHLAEIAVKDHVGRRTRTHPSAVVVAEDTRSAFPRDRPGQRHFIRVDAHGDTVTVRTRDRRSRG
ncbi:hypothetical protein BS329_16960 [Amycolatopsis coloradensis]|uniref:Uncharacterized protein n=1 Tax=Amycolatopsis coloradensis TaxID=76021 RepID=A0A1R0KTU1_9PSEU|nr:beta-ketoacyl synthase N-terminal-like domain-containing protein [Amycolatopsis coloradensis]OLZ51470.1 hypothetical protein BS329_16960 [Amycolatopsis coloradensis]